jgi:hypothetical protein
LVDLGVKGLNRVKNGGLGQVIERAGFHTFCYRINHATCRAPGNPPPIWFRVS